MNGPAAMRLDGRRALVTGSSRGIGREILLALARQGAAVIGHGVAASAALDATLAEADAEGGAVDVVLGDLGEPGAGSRLAAAALAGGAVDILVLNASLQIRRPWTDIPAAEAEQQMRTNFHASLEVIQPLAPLMQERGWGRILTIGSVQQARPHPDMLVYAASKAAQMSLVHSLARRLAASGVTINNLAPGVITTDRNAEVLADPEYARAVREAIPARSFGTSADCAGAALLLCSEAGRYITGQNLYVDGGLSLP